jgi:hypothetical protein
MRGTCDPQSVELRTDPYPTYSESGARTTDAHVTQNRSADVARTPGMTRFQLMLTVALLTLLPLLLAACGKGGGY